MDLIWNRPTGYSDTSLADTLFCSSSWSVSEAVHKSRAGEGDFECNPDSQSFFILERSLLSRRHSGSP